MEEGFNPIPYALRANMGPPYLGTKNREHLITRNLRPALIHHISKNAESKGIWLDSINAVPDHVHALISLRADQSIAKTAQLIKGESSHWLNQQQEYRLHFEWQDEYIALSVSESMLNHLRSYIGNQEAHHQKHSFREEYEAALLEMGLKPPQRKGESH